VYLHPLFRSVRKYTWGHAVAQLVEALRYKPEGHGFDSRWCHWILTCICLMAGGLLVKMWRQSVTRRDVRYVPQNVTSERYMTWHQICPTEHDVRALHDVTSDMSHERHDFVTWLLQANAHPASRISQYDNSRPVRCFWILLEFRNTIVRVRSRVIRDMIIEL